MDNREIVKQVLNNLGESTNKEIQTALNILNLDFEGTKNSIISLTKHLDNVEIAYNKILKEYQSRNNVYQ
jgi:hypothetical protein